jgi:SPP1 gp7 family putative phage head morphogenesis protein
MAEPSTNARLQDRAIRHAVYLARLQSGEARAILRLLERTALPQLRRKLIARLARIQSRGFDPGPWSTQVLRDTIAATEDVAEVVDRELYGALLPRLTDVAAAEVAWQLSVFREAVPRSIAVEVDFRTPAPNVLRQAVRSRPFQGRVLRDWTRSVGAATADRLQRELRIGLAASEGTPEIARRFDEVLNRTRRDAEAIARTATTHVASAAREQTYRENSDLVQGVRWVSTLDSRTTPTCAALDGRVFRVGEGPRPPAHVRCRSTTVPIVKPVEEILGRRALRRVPEADRASMNGPVPASQTFGPWLRSQPAAVQDRVLGEGKARLFRNQKLEIDRFVDSQYRPLTLDEVLDREGLRRLPNGGFGPSQ